MWSYSSENSLKIASTQCNGNSLRDYYIISGLCVAAVCVVHTYMRVFVSLIYT